MKIHEHIKTRTRAISNLKTTKKARRKERIAETKRKTHEISTCSTKGSRGEKEADPNLQAVDLSNGTTFKDEGV